MTAPIRPLDPATQRHIVTASDLVRHFGEWQERASRAPVYILHRGRPRHVLTSIDVMNALCVPHDQPGDQEPQAYLQAMLDVTDEALIIADGSLHLVAASLPARQLLGQDSRTGTSIERLVAGPVAPLLRESARRVIDGGPAERLELMLQRHPQRRFDATISSFDKGIALRLTDTSLADEVGSLRAMRRATDEALGAAGGLASATINLRGYLDTATPSLVTLTGLAPASLESVRLVSLVDIASRPTLGDAIERVVTGAGAMAVNVVLLVNRGPALPVRIGLAAIRHGAAVVGVAAMIARGQQDLETLKPA
jgi:PAS domain-containing protein